MSINLLPAGLQSIIQQGYLARAFEESLRAKLGFRAIADREDFPAKVGETITKSRPGLLAAVTSALTPASASDLTSGLDFTDYSVEQYSLSVAMYGKGLQTNLVTEGVAIESKFLKDASNLAEQAARSIDQIARNALFAAYLGGNTRVTQTLGSAGPAIKVDDITGFSAGMTVAVGSNTYTISSIAADGSNVSGAFNGKSGTLTMTGNVTVADGTAGNAVVASTAPLVLRPNGRVSYAGLQAGDILTSGMLLQAVAQLESNGVPKIDGFYNLYLSPNQAQEILNDSNFLKAFTGLGGSGEIRNGAVSEVYGVRFIKTNMNPQVGQVQRGMLVGKGALVEGVYTQNGYKNGNAYRDDDAVTMVDDIAHIIRGPLDALGQWATQSWCYIGGFVAPTDSGTNNSVLPTASSAAFKRGVVLETL